MEVTMSMTAFWGDGIERGPWDREPASGNAGHEIAFGTVGATGTQVLMDAAGSESVEPAARPDIVGALGHWGEISACPTDADRGSLQSALGLYQTSFALNDANVDDPAGKIGSMQGMMATLDLLGGLHDADAVPMLMRRMEHAARLAAATSQRPEDQLAMSILSRWQDCENQKP
jgi:hypothetical protein